MSLKLQISAGDLEWFRPAVLVLSALLSSWIFASALKRFSLIVALVWALASFFFTLVVFPLYLIVILIRRRASLQQRRRRLVLSMAYALVLLSGVMLYLYSEPHRADTHLAQAASAKLRGNRGKAIAEYQAALRETDDPHTHKLLAIELLALGDWTAALAEFRRAEQGGEPDDLVILNIASLLELLNQPNQAELEYKRFLESNSCIQPLPDSRCESVRRRIQEH